MRLSIQTPILRCKVLVGDTQTLELHPLDAGCAIASLSLIHLFGFTVTARPSVNIPLANPATVGASQTPSRPNFTDRRSKNRIGKISVPNKDTINERAGRSSAVKKEEKQLSAQPTK